MSEEAPRENQLKKRYWLKNLYLISRVMVIIAIIGLLISSIIVIITGFVQLFRIISFFMHEGLLHDEAGKFLSVTVTEMIDLYLIGLVLIIIALGLYQLFIDPDIEVPDWLDTPSIDTLKGRLLVVILVVLPVTFLGYVATAKDGIAVAGYGIGISLVMIAIGFVLSIATRASIEKKRLETQKSEED